MQYMIWKEMTFDASHALGFLPPSHKCSRLHGHTYCVRVAVSGPLVPPLGWVMDLGALKEAMGVMVGMLDHRHLNDIPGLEQPTAENVAAWVAERVNLALPGGVTLAAVEVRETPTSGVALTFGAGE